MSEWEGYAAESAADDYYANPAAAERELAAYEADEGPLGCCHDDDEIEEDEHRAECMKDAAAAARLARREGQWDSQGVSGYEL